MNKKNPFFFGDPIPVGQFIGRRSEIRRIASRICSSGSSTALIGEPRSGKTSILKYVTAAENRVSLYEDWAARLLFVEIDVQSLERGTTSNQVWELILGQIKGEISSIPSVMDAYQSCRLNSWSTFALEKFFRSLQSADYRLVLVIDEFGSFFDHPDLHTADFYGKLRSLSTRFESFVLLLASRYPLERLHQETLQINRSGSPFFNFFAPLTLKPFSSEEVDLLLKRAGRRFTKQERLFLEDLSGGHPYLLQVAAYLLWESYVEGEKDTHVRQKNICDELYGEAADTLGASWSLWSPKTKIAFMTIVLNEIPLLTTSRSFDITTLTKHLEDLEPEVHFLADQGYISPEEILPGGWQVRTKAFIWWLAAELRRAVRSDESFEKWFADQEWNGLLTHGEKENFKKVLQKAYPLIMELIKVLLKRNQPTP